MIRLLRSVIFNVSLVVMGEGILRMHVFLKRTRLDRRDRPSPWVGLIVPKVVPTTVCALGFSTLVNTGSSGKFGM